jgi:hypothetical protein
MNQIWVVSHQRYFIARVVDLLDAIAVDPPYYYAGQIMRSWIIQERERTSDSEKADVHKRILLSELKERITSWKCWRNVRCEL